MFWLIKYYVTLVISHLSQNKSIKPVVTRIFHRNNWKKENSIDLSHVLVT